MTLDEMLAIFDASLRAAAADDYDRSLDTVDPRVTLVTVPQWPDGGRAEGTEAVWRMSRRLIEGLGDAISLVDPEAVGPDTLVFEVGGRLQPVESQAGLNWHYGALVRFRNARILLIHYFDTREEALAAARDG
jgi:hypothetical protein